MATQKKPLLDRLSRIEGQVRGIAQMLTDERYCIDVLNQIQAVKAALAKVETAVLKNHANGCVSHAIASGDPEEQRKKFGELIELMEKVKR